MLDDDIAIYKGLDVSRRKDIALTSEIHATLITAVGGGPLRTLITGGKRHPTGRYSSAKTRRAHPRKSTAERARMMICEVDANVASYLAQPHRLDMAFEGERFQFFADLRIDYRSGRVGIEKIRSDAEVTRGLPEPRATELARQAYAILGWTSASLSAPTSSGRAADNRGGFRSTGGRRSTSPAPGSRGMRSQDLAARLRSARWPRRSAAGRWGGRRYAR